MSVATAECILCGELTPTDGADPHPMCEDCLSRCYWCGKNCDDDPCADARQAAIDRADLERRRALEPPTRCYGPWHWRRWRLTGWVFGRLYVLGITAWGATYGNKCTRPMSLRSDCPGHQGWVIRGPGWGALDPRRKRVYVLGMRTEWLLLLPTCLRAGHWPLWLEGMGCGKCTPWPCCGATGYDHAEGCTA